MATDVMLIDAEKLIRMQTLHVAFVLLDVRGQNHFEKGHIKSAFNLPVENFSQNLNKMVPSKETPIVVYDEDGSTIEAILRDAEKEGFINIVGLEGGFKAYSLLSNA